MIALFTLYFTITSPIKLPYIPPSPKNVETRMQMRMSIAKQAKVIPVPGVRRIKRLSASWFTDEGNIYYVYKFTRKTRYVRSLFRNKYTFNLSTIGRLPYRDLVFLPSGKLVVKKDKNKIYIYKPDGTLHKIMNIPENSNIYSMGNGDILVYTDKQIIRINVKSEKVIWKLSGVTIYNFTFYENSDFFLLYDGEGSISAVSWNTGKVLWTTYINPDKSSFYWGTMLKKPYVIRKNKLYILSPGTGKIIKKYTFDFTLIKVSSLELKNAFYFLIKKQNRYMLVFFSLDSGKIKWAMELGDLFSPTVFYNNTSDIVILLASRLLGISPDGKIRWVADFPDSINHSFPKLRSSFYKKYSYRYYGRGNRGFFRNNLNKNRNIYKLKNEYNIESLHRLPGGNILVKARNKIYFVYP